jgi:hypothetical protein
MGGGMDRARQTQAAALVVFRSRNKEISSLEWMILADERHFVKATSNEK